MNLSTIAVVTLSVLCALGAPARAELTAAERLGNIQGVTLPLESFAVPLKRKGHPTDTAGCDVFPEWVVTTWGHPDMDGRETRVLRRRKGITAKQACLESLTTGKAVRTDDEIIGMAGDVLLYLDGDGFGGSEGFTLYDAKTGRELLRDMRYLDTPAVFAVATNGAVSLHYRRELELKCRLDAPGCWQDTLKAAGAPDSVPPPVCPASDGDPRGLQVYAEVRVADLRRVAFAYEVVRPVCEIAP